MFLLALGLWTNLKAPFNTDQKLYQDEKPVRLESSFYLCPGNKSKITHVAHCFSDGKIEIYSGNDLHLYDLIWHTSSIRKVEISKDGLRIYSWDSHAKITWCAFNGQLLEYSQEKPY